LWGGNSRPGRRELHHGMLDPDGCLVRSGSQPVRRKRMRLRVCRQSMARQQKEFRWIAVAMKIAIATAIQRWLNSCLDFGLLMGVAIRNSAFDELGYFVEKRSRDQKIWWPLRDETSYCDKTTENGTNNSLRTMNRKTNVPAWRFAVRLLGYLSTRGLLFSMTHAGLDLEFHELEIGAAIATVPMVAALIDSLRS
ncbi:hypothetical protein, partial [Paraburkholderia sediminicola]|uniref:hypothetical protein n=1 Tax=Paraburkholderia sediminicola TaxID=458836 RepID=UPI0038B88FA3